jgi:hypothetical protein
MPFETTATSSCQGSVRQWALGLLATALLLTGCESQADRDQKAADAAYREKLAKAQAIFAERCKTAGVVIHRTVKDVEGIELTKIRPKLEYADKRYFDPMFDGAAMAGEASGEGYIMQFLLSEYRPTFAPERRGELSRPEGPPGHQRLPGLRGYRFVNATAADGKMYRISLPWDPGQTGWNGSLQRVEVSSSTARFALDFEDLVDPADRAYWVAGTKLRVIDKQNGKVIAELTRFVIDPGFGESSSGRWPWSHANSRATQRCPSDASQPLNSDSRYFIDTVLIPKQGD